MFSLDLPAIALDHAWTGVDLFVRTWPALFAETTPSLRRSYSNLRVREMINDLYCINLPLVALN